MEKAMEIGESENTRNTVSNFHFHQLVVNKSTDEGSFLVMSWFLKRYLFNFLLNQ